MLAYVVGKKAERMVFVSSADPDSLSTLSDMFKMDRKAPVSVLLDSIDQSYQSQSFPPVARFSVQKLVAQKLKRDFAPGDITSALPLGREKTGRQDWKFLLISVVPSPQLMQWLDFLLELDNPFDSIYLVPVEAENFMRDLSGKVKEENKSAWQMLVIHNKVSGFRQIITRNGRLIFTRLTQSTLGENSPLVIAGNIEQEIGSTIEYLKRLSYQESEGLDITVIASPEIVQSIDDSKIGSHRNARFITPAQAAETVSLPAEHYAENHFCDILFSTYFTRVSKHILKLQTPLSRNIKKYQLGLTAIKYSAISIGAALLIAAAYQGYQWFDSHSSESPIQQSIEISQKEIETIKKETELLPADIEKIEDAVSIYEVFSAQKYLPLDFVRQLAEVNMEGVLVNDIQWQSDATYERRAAKLTPDIVARAALAFTKKFDTAEARLRQINAYLEELRVKFPEYQITNSAIPGTLNEGRGITIDFTNPQSRNLLSGDIVMTIDFHVAGQKGVAP